MIARNTATKSSTKSAGKSSGSKIGGKKRRARNHTVMVSSQKLRCGGIFDVDLAGSVALFEC